MGDWRDDRSVFDGGGSGGRAELEQRLSEDRIFTDHTDADPDSQSPALETAERFRTGTVRRQGAFPKRGTALVRRKSRHALLFLLLRSGADCGSLGQQLSGGLRGN